ncbi:Helicase [uncultured virus]|nr:Helicase [uncultured virus]
MEANLDYAVLMKLCEAKTKPSFRAYEIDGKPRPNIANLGGKIGDVVKIERSGEYMGLAVELLYDQKPLLTDIYMHRLLSMLEREDFVTPLELMAITSLEQLHYILYRWFGTALIDGEANPVPKPKQAYNALDQWIISVSHDPISGPIKVTGIGQNQNTGDSVVPPEWLDRVFDSGIDMHRQMDKLPSRAGKSPVTYAVIYGMTIQTNDALVTDLTSIKYETIFYLELKKNSLVASRSIKLKPDYSYVKYGSTLIGFVLDDLLAPKGKIEGEHTQSKLHEVGLLVSRLQKAIRRGRYGSKALVETVDALNVSPNYNLPEHGFLRVSASKQLVWRLFITILEDCRPYQAVTEPSLLDLMLLVLITQKLQEYKFTDLVLNAIRRTAILAQYNDEPTDGYKWGALSPASKVPLTDSPFRNALALGLANVIMMAGDNEMLRKYYTASTVFAPFDIPVIDGSKKPNEHGWFYHKASVYKDIILSSYDPHSKTCIILYYQACIPVSLTTKQISGYIWDQSSSYNVRYSEPVKPDPVLRTIQSYFRSGAPDTSRFKPSPEALFTKLEPSSQAKRTSFIVAFGRRYRAQGKDTVIAGNLENPARVKVDNEWLFKNDKSILNAYPKQTVRLAESDPPPGFKWTRRSIVTSITDGQPMIDGEAIEFFDGSLLLESNTPKTKLKPSSAFAKQIVRILSGLDLDFEEILKLRHGGVDEMLDWIPKASIIPKLNLTLIKLAYTKLFNQFNNIIMIGPVSRSGQKMANSINYLLEGKLWAVYNLISYLYPDTIKGNGVTNFFVRKDKAGYTHLIQTLEAILFQPSVLAPIKVLPKVHTQLWDHQTESVNRILAGFSKGRFGFGDASDVGAGKTLTSITIAVKLIRKPDPIYSGILIMLPGNQLIKTWRDELAKHTTGFDIIFQGNSSDIGPIGRNTILVTTMGRMRDHPIHHKWLLMVIDECLTVQNKNALWTEEAWKQSMMAKHLVMMSATFFRTRFDKLYYMLKMLNSGLPERREYLDAILLETIVSQVSKVKRKWTSNFHHFTLDPKARKQYTEIEQSSLSLETKFAKLTSLLISSAKTNKTVVEQLSTLVQTLSKRKRHCLLYARAADEAQFWSTNLGIPIYPTKGKHCIVTVSDGTYGLNDLVIYNTIIMRPPPPDKLPQMKGRLDRPGQEDDNLFIEYFVLANTIEEGLILRLNIATAFLHKYIMPLAKFYDVSVNYQKYLDAEQKN